MAVSFFWHIDMDTKKLRKRYMQLVPHLNKALQHVNTQLSDVPSSEFVLETNLKPYMSVKRKMEADRVQDPVELSDLARGRLFYSEQFDIDDVLNIVKQLFGKSINSIDKNGHRSKEHGLEYRGVVHVDLGLNGIRFELQLMPLEFKPHKDFLHQIYEKFRDPKSLDKLSEKQQELLRKMHNEMYKKLDKEAKEKRKNS